MAEDERSYLLRRSEQHRSQARASDDEAARNLHDRFADAYADRAASIVDED